MIDDPREVLKEAGVECAEAGRYLAAPDEVVPVVTGGGQVVPMRVWHERPDPDTAILALARLVVRYKWLAEHDIQIVPKDDWHTPGEPDQVGGFAVERRAGFVLTHLHSYWDARQP